MVSARRPDPRPRPAAAPAPGPAEGSLDERLERAGLPPLPRATWLEIDVARLAANAAWIRGRLPAGARLGVVVKADGYGHGLLAAARAALRGGAAMLLVATVDEALVLRRARITAPILVLYPVPRAMLPVAAGRNLDVVVADDASLTDAVAFLRARGVGGGGRPASVRPRIHLAIDTGMARGGFAPEAAAAGAERLLAAGLPRLAGTWSHLATPEDAGAVDGQARRLEEALGALRARGIEPGVVHLSATGGLVAGAPAHGLVRAGLAFYGVTPPELAGLPAADDAAAALRPALSLRARAATVCDLPAGAAVGYGGTWVAERPSRIATVALGYADGWIRGYAAGSWAVVRGVRAPLVGRVSSDAIAVDVTDVPGFGAADVLTFLDPDEPAAMSPLDLARLRGSIVWEVLDDLSPRIARAYVERGVPVAVRYLDGRLVEADRGAGSPAGARRAARGAAPRRA